MSQAAQQAHERLLNDVLGKVGIPGQRQGELLCAPAIEVKQLLECLVEATPPYDRSSAGCSRTTPLGDALSLCLAPRETEILDPHYSLPFLQTFGLMNFGTPKRAEDRFHFSA
jgi:hypothetical protein